MKVSDRVALLYAAGLLGAGALSFYRGRRGSELVVDTALQGVIIGTGLNVVIWLTSESSSTALLNSSAVKNMGAMSGEAIQLLQKLDVDTLYGTLKKNGVTVGPVPDNPSVIDQDET